jgi:hypothetical protein
MDFIEWEMEVERLEEKTEFEGARVSDVIWSGWEMSRNHDRMLATMRERFATTERDGANKIALNLESANEIQETSLPCCFEMEDDEQVPPTIHNP